jgi:hypothetical protein
MYDEVYLRLDLVGRFVREQWIGIGKVEWAE